MTLVLWPLAKSSARLGVVVDLILLALVTELMQLYTPDRHGNFNDVVVNIGGIASGSLVYFSGRKRSELPFLSR